ncbi:RadC family protein [Luteimonas saliphila]|uniref:RadC family protein n=1 Tax=Luteimonas saliphila TaxID=2804919 RepID=UPI00192D8BEF|nr:DNA repair protein RadC [Luteimonas saliphila]
MSFSSFDSPLFVRDSKRRYQLANADQILEAARRMVDQRMQRGTSFLDPSIARGFFRDKLAGLEREVFVAAFLDTRHRLVHYAELFQGTIDGAEVHPRVIVREALMCNSAAILASHNHPSGNPEPSAADRAVTARLKQALALVDIRLLDHIIVGGNATLSLAERGWV